MAESNQKAIQNAQTSEELTGMKVGAPSTVAAGLPAVVSSMKHLIGEVGALRSAQVMFKLNQVGGTDCPGCAWPDPDDERSGLGEYCENGAKAIAEEATTKTINADFFRRHSIDELATWSDYKIGKAGRLLQPMVLRPGSRHYEPIAWQDAFNLAAKHFNDLHSPNEAIFYTSGRTSNEAAFLYQLMVREFGTNNLPDCSNMCHESSGVALSKTVGIGKGSVKLEDFYEADLILVIGQNPGTNHPRMLSAMQKAKRNGAKIISINPLPESGLIRFKHPQHIGEFFGQGTPLSDLFLQVKINGDVALMKAIMKRLLEIETSKGGVFDHDFIQKKTEGYEAFLSDLEKQDVQRLSEECGISLEEIEKAVAMIESSPKMICCWAMGLTQHKNGVANIQEVVNLLLLRGSIGKPGAGTCPVRGHSNVQGDRTMGIWEKPKPAFLDALDKEFGIKTPRHHGYDTVEAIKAMYEGKARVFFGMGGNFLSATPDTNYTAEALSNCSLTVHVSTKLNRSHLVTGETALIFPCLGRTELDTQAQGDQFVTVENSMGVVHQSLGNLAPLSQKLKSEPAIVTGLAQALFPNSVIPWASFSQNYDRVRDRIEKVIPGFDRYNERVRQPGGFYLPNGARDGNFTTPDSKAHFTVNEVPHHTLAANEYLMMTVRSHDQFNTTIYGLDDRYRGVSSERRVIFMNRDDIHERGWHGGDIVDIVSHFEGEERRANRFLLVPFSIPRQCLASYFPETNVLVPINSFADKSQTPTSKLIRVTLEKQD